MPPLTADQRRLYAELLLRPEVDVPVVYSDRVGVKGVTGVVWVKHRPNSAELIYLNRAERIAALIADGTIDVEFVKSVILRTAISGMRPDLVVIDEVTDIKDAP